ncbi:MAG: hypothetical protein QOC93_2283 [Actinomycetota bacterium]|jgi:hypothetical protein|nr:hypothetical protein [Actinomycetota bacterium]
MTEQPATRPADTQRQRRGHDFYPPTTVAAAIPPLYGTEDTPTVDKVLHLRYFAAAGDWWIAEYDPGTGTALGYACLGDPDCAEWGYLDLPELEQVNVRSGLLIVERDLHWTATRTADAGLPGANAT